jgi:hypothetical protein
MNTKVKTGFAAILLLAISCTKENNNIQLTTPIDKSSTSDLVTTVSGGWVKIGNQKWMAKNLDVTRYRNGDNIPQVTDPTQWANLKKGAWCWFNNDSVTGAVYGRLYKLVCGKRSTRVGACGLAYTHKG